MRVDGVNQLVDLAAARQWRLGPGPRSTATFASNERLDVQVKAQVPIHTTYITAWANKQGTVSFRDDVYEFDAQGKVTFEDA